MTVPFLADEEALAHCAQEFGVLWTHMSHFYNGSGGEKQLRLFVSALQPQQIEEGVGRVSRFILGKLDSQPLILHG